MAEGHVIRSILPLRMRRCQSTSVCKSLFKEYRISRTSDLLVTITQGFCDFTSKLVHDLIIGSTIKVIVSFAYLPIFEQDRYLEGLESLVYIVLVGRDLPRACSIE